MKNAQPVEYYLELGNSMYVVELGPNNYEKSYSIYSTEELLQHINRVEAKNVFNQEYTLDLKFRNRDLILPKRPRKQKQLKEYPHYYILVSKCGKVFVRKLKWGYRYTYCKDDIYAKRFKSEEEARKYLEKYSSLKDKFMIEKVDEPAMF